MVPIETEHYRVLVNETHHFAILDWNKAVGPREYKKGYSDLCRLLSKYKLKKCLVNSGRRGGIPLEGGEWDLDILERETIEKEVRDLQLALVMTEEEYQQIVQNYSVTMSTRNAALQNHVHYFTKVEEALDWLSHESISE